MKTFTVHTLGCKVNQYESQQIRQLCEQAGLSAALRDADLVVVNTCCVTHVASSKSRQAVARLCRKHPSARVIVAGCLPVGQDSELSALPENCLIVKDKKQLPNILNSLLQNPKPQTHTGSGSKPLKHCKIKDKNTPPTCDSNVSETHFYVSDTTQNEGILHAYKGQTRAFLKVQDGCDAHCTYCIIPKIRTEICSKDPQTVLSEAANLVAAGHREIVLTGIFLGAYGQSTARRKHWDASKRDQLAALVAQVASLSGLARLRLSSLEPADVTDRLLDVFRSFPNIMPHLHLPLQSGDPEILRRMARQYRIEDFLEVIDRVKSALDRPAITTDIIVGFPGESEGHFSQTMDIARRVNFSKIHVFSFSIRKNTPAEKFTPKVPPAVIHERSARLTALDKELQTQYARQFLGQPVEVLIESIRPPRGRCQRYFMVDLSAHPDASTFKKGQIVRTVLTVQHLMCDPS